MTNTARVARFGCPAFTFSEATRPIACPPPCPATLQASGNTNAAAQALAQAAAQGGGSASALAQVPATGCHGWGEETACRHGHAASCRDGLRCLVLNMFLPQLLLLRAPHLPKHPSTFPYGRESPLLATIPKRCAFTDPCHPCRVSHRPWAMAVPQLRDRRWPRLPALTAAPSLRPWRRPSTSAGARRRRCRAQWASPTEP